MDNLTTDRSFDYFDMTSMGSCTRKRRQTFGRQLQELVPLTICRLVKSSYVHSKRMMSVLKNNKSMNDKSIINK